MAHQHPTHKLSELIALLVQKHAEHGDLPVIYWDQNSSCTFDNPSRVLSVEDGFLYFGGMHVLADNFCSKNTTINEGSARGRCDFDDDAEEEAVIETAAAAALSSP